jgi:hypothetical protein
MTFEQDRFTRAATVAWEMETEQRSLTEPWSPDDGVWVLSVGLAGYLGAVADALGVPAEGTTFEVSDTVTAYLALNRRWPQRPGRDLMLVWGELTGWIVSVETDPGETPMVVARLGGADSVPEPRVVAQFVTDALARNTAAPTTLVVSVPSDRTHLAESLTRYAARSESPQ